MSVKKAAIDSRAAGDQRRHVRWISSRCRGRASAHQSQCTPRCLPRDHNRDDEDTAYYIDAEFDLIASPPHARGRMTRKDGTLY
jgi:hypothetical protein